MSVSAAHALLFLININALNIFFFNTNCHQTLIIELGIEFFLFLSDKFFP